MHAHIVLAHPEPQSFNAHLADVTRRSLEGQGWSVSIADLYAMGFDPCEKAEHYRDRQDSRRFDAQAEQRNASARGTIPPFIGEEIGRLDRADLLILQYPLWWHLPPAIMKGWFDRVLIYGEVYDSKKRFENGRFAGKRAMISVTVGTSEDSYAFDGRSGDIDLLLWPVNFTLAYVGYAIVSPLVAYGVEAGLRYSDERVVKLRLKKVEEDFRHALAHFDHRPAIPFNRMAEWGSNGRILPGAGVYSPFIRRKQHLSLE
jgi:NAD(P)H dehydrogenase (quinone)